MVAARFTDASARQPAGHEVARGRLHRDQTDTVLVTDIIQAIEERVSDE